MFEHKIPSFWPFLSVFQKAGCFPCRKVTNKETHQTSMQPLNGCVHGLIYMICVSIVFASVVFGFYNLYSKPNTTHDSPFEFVLDYFGIGSSLQNSPFDLTVLVSIYVILWGMHWIILLLMVTSKRALCDVYNYFIQNCSIDYNIITILMKSFSRHLIKILFFICTGWSLYISAFTLNILNGLNYKFVTFLPSLISWILLLVYCLAPILAFHIYFLEVSLLLSSWILSLQEKLKQDQINTFTFLIECKKLIIALRLLVSTVSKLILCLFVTILIFCVADVYLAIAFFISQDEFTTANILIMMGYGCFGLLWTFLAYDYCNFSQDIKDSVNAIKNDLLDLEVKGDQICIIDGKAADMQHAKQRTPPPR